MFFFLRVFFVLNLTMARFKRNKSPSPPQYFGNLLQKVVLLILSFLHWKKDLELEEKVNLTAQIDFFLDS